MTLEEIVEDFIRCRRQPAIDEMERYKELPDLPTVIEQAALSLTPEGKRHDHQRLNPPEALVKAERSLQNKREELGRAANFDELHDLVEHNIRHPIWGIGELATYDIAHRIGAKLGLAPTRVYLHAGTRKGAKKLGLSGRTLRVDQLPPVFSRLTAAEIEDCLCHYRHVIGTDDPPKKRGGGC